jgi:hypothetical protein
MFRTILIYALASAPLAIASLGCDKSDTEAQAEVNQAQNKANDEIAKANDKVTTTTAQAQAAVDQRIAAVQGDFAATREDYRHKMQTNLDALTTELADIDVKAKTATGAHATDLRATIPALHAQRGAFVTDYKISRRRAQSRGTRRRLASTRSGPI